MICCKPKNYYAVLKTASCLLSRKELYFSNTVYGTVISIIIY